MKIKHYLYNSFLIKTNDKILAIDPGAELYFFRFLKTIIPKTDWKSITHIFVTHGDPDHYWNTDRVAEISNAAVICNKSMEKEVNGEKLLLGPRDKGLAFTTKMKNLHLLSVNETITLDDMNITGIKSTHGPLHVKLGPFSKTVQPGENERIGHGAIGFQITFDGKTIVNLGDTFLEKEAWQNIKNPDILMIPIGGEIIKNTMNVQDAIETIKMIKPKHVIPCHYNCDAFFTKEYNKADDKYFKSQIEEMNINCTIMKHGDEIEL